MRSAKLGSRQKLADASLMNTNALPLNSETVNDERHEQNETKRTRVIKRNRDYGEWNREPPS